MKQCLCEKCWKGYEKKGMKTMFGKRYPNCVKKEAMTEDGHTDVASAERKLKIIIKDSLRTIKMLRRMSNEDSLPSWWTDKVTLAKDYIEKSSNYISNPAESVNEAERKMSSLEMQQIILLAKAMKQLPGSPAQKKIKKQINVIRKKLGQAPVKESVNEKVDKIGAIKKAFPWAKGKMMNVIQMAIEMDVDGLAGVMKNYKKNPSAYKQFVRDMSKMRGLPDLKESVNEAVEPRGNIKKVLDVAKNKQAKKIGGTLVDGTTANMMTQVWNKVNDSSKEKMNKMNTKQLINLILRLWKAMGTPRV
tara:strand:- start:443 stop:1354 length:912 start_codon:yes stop_codon:yes gene_type:complete